MELTIDKFNSLSTYKIEAEFGIGYIVRNNNGNTIEFVRSPRLGDKTLEKLFKKYLNKGIIMRVEFLPSNNDKEKYMVLYSENNDVLSCGFVDIDLTENKIIEFYNAGILK